MAASRQPNSDDEWQHWSSADVSAPGGFAKHIVGEGPDPYSWLAYVENDPVPTVADDYAGTDFDLNGDYADLGASAGIPDDPAGADE